MLFSKRSFSLLTLAFSFGFSSSPLVFSQNTPQVAPPEHGVAPHGFAISPLGTGMTQDGAITTVAGTATSRPEGSPAVATPAEVGITPAGQQAATPDLAKTVTAARAGGEVHAAKPQDNASQQGIKVHGHWVIDVRNPDGTLAAHRDFENSLVGANDMLGFLYGSEVMSDLAVYLGSSTPPCNVSSSYYCDLVHNLSVLPASARCGYDYCVTGLTITPTFGQNPALVLAGNMTATQAGSITTVGTFIGLCGSPTSTPTTTSPSSCAAGNNQYGYGALTQTSITSVAITSGQIIQVTVTITFS